MKSDACFVRFGRFGRFGGTAETDDDEPFEERFTRLAGHLKEQFAESERLRRQILANLETISKEPGHGG